MSSLVITTDRQLAGLKPLDKRYERRVSGARGLSVRVWPSGLTQFEVRYAVGGGPRRRTILGDYPAVSLADAREKATALRLDVLKGVDPVAERIAAQRPAPPQETLDQVAETYWAASELGLHGGRRRPKRPRTIANERHLWQRHISASLGATAPRDLKRVEVKTFMRSLVTERHLSAASAASIGGLLHSILAYCVQEELVDANPVVGLARPLALVSRDRLLDDAGLKLVWDIVLDGAQPRPPGYLNIGLAARPEPVMALAIQLLMLTLTRRNEVAGARKAEFDLDAGLWVIPAERAKANHQHVVPLSPQALNVLTEAFALDPASPFVFPSPRVADQCIDEQAITRTFSRIFERRKLPLRSPHDVRRTGATTLTGRYGVTRFIVGLVLGHTPKDGAAVTAVYDRYTYVPEKRDALVRWAGHLTGVPVGLPAAGVNTTAAAADRAEDLETAKRRALDLCSEGRTQQAVMTMCMAASRVGAVSPAHMDLLANIGLELAGKNDWSELEAWINGFGQEPAATLPAPSLPLR
ncbi:site-specific recombinase, phage integrase family protein [Brevundimonas sp. BAL3]|uniref:tyrosine-type recombinase/integrase n=1 Tax=Brevundimonas sp. BAL3 TaxID=391600 RepID=UPI00017ED0F4|nr:site-specific integrase [Brevundimonas sp. BAL3]EDX78916.1 site-specific recombinase, phage integrase family protein [Brevundimonas sp. BAL3]